MAEILIKVADYVNADPIKDRRGVHKRGDIVNVKPDGWSNSPNWAQSSYPYARGRKFVLVKIPGVSVEEFLYLRESLYNGVDEDGNPIVHTRHRWGVQANFVNHIINRGGIINTNRMSFLNQVIEKRLS